MFDFFRSKTRDEYIEEGRRIYGVPEQPQRSEPVKAKEPQEYYRIGARPDGMTTITLMSDNGMAMTLSLNQSGCEQMIRMIRATYPEVQPTENEI